MFILSSNSSGLEFWSENHTSLYDNSETKIFKNIKKTDQQFIRNKCILLKLGDNYCWQYCNGLILLQWFLKEAHFYPFHLYLSYFCNFGQFVSFRRKKLKIMSRLHSKCNPIFFFIYIYSYWRIISHSFKVFSDILQIILDIWYRIFIPRRSWSF